MKKRKKVNRKKDKAPTPSIVDFASSTADLVAKMAKLAGENDCVEDAYSAFKYQLQEQLDEKHREFLAKLMYECYEEFKTIRGSEKSGFQSDTNTDATISSSPEPVPKEVENSVKTIKNPDPPVTPWRPCGEVVLNENTANDLENIDTNEEVKYKSLYGYGVTEEEAPGKYWIDKLLEKGAYAKQDIVTLTQYHPDTVRKRITYIEKHIPEIVIVKDSNKNTKEPVLRAQPKPLE